MPTTTTGDRPPVRVRTGEFVRLRPLVRGDAATTLRWRTDARARLLNSGARTVVEQEAWIAGRPADEWNFVVELADGTPVGMLSLVDVDLAAGTGEPARFLIGEEEAVRGVPVAVEAMKLLYELAFDELGLQLLSGCVAADNRLMIKWQKYLGMRETGRRTGDLDLDDGVHDSVLLALEVDRYRSVTLPRMNALVAAARGA